MPSSLAPNARACAALALATACALGQSPDEAAKLEFFEQRIRPVLASSCYELPAGKTCALLALKGGAAAAMDAASPFSALARKFAKEGYKCALLARNSENIEKLAAELGAGHNAYVCDATDSKQVA